MAADGSLHVLTGETAYAPYVDVVHVDLTGLLRDAFEGSCLSARVAGDAIQIDVPDDGVVASRWHRSTLVAHIHL